MSRSVAAGVLCAAAALALPALAQNTTAYAGVGAGRSKADIDCAGTLTCDTSATGWKVFAGYMFHPNFGVEGAWFDQGKAKFSAAVTGGPDAFGEFRGRGFGLYAIGQASQGPWSGFIKAGITSTRATGSARVADIAGSVRETHTNFGWGLGGGYDFTRNFGARLEFERARAELLGDKVNIDLVTLGLLARF